MYDFMQEWLGLKSFRQEDGSWDESGFAEESEVQMQVFGHKAEQLPPGALKNFEALEETWRQFLNGYK